MGFFSKLVLFSRVEGRVTLNGEPVSGVEVVQQASYLEPGDLPTTAVRTDASGRFSFDEISRRAGLGGLLPGEMRVSQKLLLRYDGQEFEGWRHSKTSGEPNGELDGKPLKLVCELTTAPDFEGTHYGICRVDED